MLIKQIIAFEWRGPGPAGCTCTLQLIISRRNKYLKAKSSIGLIFTAKILQEAICLIQSKILVYAYV